VELISEGAAALATVPSSSPKVENDAPTSFACEDPPTFDQFCQCYDGRGGWFHLSTDKRKENYLLTSYLVQPEFHVADASFGAMARDGVKFCILWLTESVFISSFSWVDLNLHDYQIAVTPWDSSDAIVFYVYTLSSFRGLRGPRRGMPPSLDPISFLASMTTQLHNGYFKNITVDWRRNDVPIPPEKFLAIVPANPRSRRQGPVDCKALTLVEFCNWLQLQDLLTALSYCEEHSLAVRHVLRLKKLDTNANNALRECPDLRHIDIRQRFFLCFLHSSLKNEVVPFTENHHIESISIQTYYWKCVLPFFKGAAGNRGLKRLYVTCACWQETLLQDIGLFLGSLCSASPLQEFIVLSFIGKDDYEKRFNSLTQVLDSCSISARTKLCHFSIVTTRSVEEPAWPVPAFEKALVNSEMWDKLVSPRFALNWYINYLAQFRESRAGSNATAAVKETLVPWTVRAVNLDTVYRKTTYHTPHDTTTANASVLYFLLSHVLSIK
jgi:hypothetical protein